MLSRSTFELGQGLAVRWDREAGTLDFLRDGVVWIKGARSRVRMEGAEPAWPLWSRVRGPRGGRIVFTGRTEGGIWELAVSAAFRLGSGWGFRLELFGTANRSRRTAALAPLVVATLEADHVLVHGRGAGRCRALPLPVAERVDFASFLHLTVTRQGVSTLLSQPMRQRHPSALRGRAEGRTVRNLSVETPFDPGVGGRVQAEPLLLFAGPDGHALLESWAREQRPRPPVPPEPRVGWNTWDYFRWTVTEEAVLRNAEFIASDPVLRRHVKRVIVDDGWQYCYGEWEANPLFSHGMAWLARRLARLGFEPGLWIAPGVVEPHARLSQWDMDMLAKGRSGLPCLAFNCMERRGFLLDPTVPKTRRWLYDLFRRYAERGYRYFKLDFLSQTLNAPVFADPSVPRGDVIRLLLEPARRALRGRATIMACGYDFFAGADLTHEVRTSSDIHARWDAIKENVHSIAARWWAQGRFWNNDPDFALCRGPDTARDPDLNRLRCRLVHIPPEAPAVPFEPFTLATMTLAEARTLLSLVLISGGAVNLSDDLTRLNAVGLDLARRTVAAERGAAGIPLDLFVSAEPSYWRQRLSRGRRLLLVNWSDRQAERVLPLAEGEDALVWRDVWTDAPVRPRRNRIEVRLDPHACLLVEGHSTHPVDKSDPAFGTACALLGQTKNLP